MMVSFMLLAIFGVAQSLPVAGEGLADGLIVSATGAGYELTNTAYDENIFGVLASNAAAVLDTPEVAEAIPVITSGVAKVTVSGASGPIEPGDLITSSDVAGVGMKATQTGFVLGVAKEAFTGSSAEEVGQVEVALNIQSHALAGRQVVAPGLAGFLNDFLNLSALGIQDTPSTALRYGMAIVILLVSFALGLLTFGRIATNAIAAMGRNPMARAAIGLTAVFNVMMAMVVVGAGFGLAYLILVT